MSRQPNFDRIARIYRTAEYLSLGPILQRTRTHFIPHLVQARNAFVLGDGDGRFLAQLLAANRNLHAVAIDTSDTMLHLLRQRCRYAAPNATARLETIHASAIHVEVPANTDLVVTHFFLDCLTQSNVDALVNRVAQRTQPGTLWLLSDFAIPTNPITRPLARLYVRALYLAFGILTGLQVKYLPDPQTALSNSGFVRIHQHEKLGGLIYTELWQRQ